MLIISIKIMMLKVWASRGVEKQCVPDECPGMGQWRTHFQKFFGEALVLINLHTSTHSVNMTDR